MTRLSLIAAAALTTMLALMPVTVQASSMTLGTLLPSFSFPADDAVTGSSKGTAPCAAAAVCTLQE